MTYTAMELQTAEPAGRTRRQPAPTSHEQPAATPTALTIITNTANINDVTQTLALVDGIPPVASRPGRHRRRPDSLLGDKGNDSNPNAGHHATARSCQSSPARAA
ncbi:hypothetical protein ABT065_42415 [Streptomyces sp. NPDC002764]|uniref:hypothetical protein n=1 Tax=Streptomyces sp. NPDC002764 TaxID=3154428 RepID=UPI0033279F2B